MDLSFVREKIERGELPSEEWEQTRVVRGGFQTCAACGTPTTPVYPAVECHQGENRVVLHPDCYVMWEEAVRRDTGTEEPS